LSRFATQPLHYNPLLLRTDLFSPSSIYLAREPSGELGNDYNRIH
jgi:hypothetical protein